MIVILEKYQILQKKFGLDPHGVRANILTRIIFSISLILSVLLPSIFLLLNFRDNTHLALSTVPPLFGFVATVLNYFHLVINCERIHCLLEQLQHIANESMFRINCWIFLETDSSGIWEVIQWFFSGTNLDEDSGVIYTVAEQRITLATKIIMTGVASVPATLSPFLLVAFHWYTGKYTIKSWFLFYPIW